MLRQGGRQWFSSYCCMVLVSFKAKTCKELSVFLIWGCVPWALGMQRCLPLKGGKNLKIWLWTAREHWWPQGLPEICCNTPPPFPAEPALWWSSSPSSSCWKDTNHQLQTQRLKDLFWIFLERISNDPFLRGSNPKAQAETGPWVLLQDSPTILTPLKPPDLCNYTENLGHFRPHLGPIEPFLECEERPSSLFGWGRDS